MKTPNCLEFTPQEIDALIERIEGKCLQEGDYFLLIEVLRAMIWLSFSLKEKELTIKRLRKIFGIKTESAKKLFALANGSSSEPKKSSDEGESSDAENSGLPAENETAGKESEHAQSQSTTKPEEQKSPKNHGHRSSAEYSQAKIISIAHEALKKGDKCPACLKGKLFNLKPGTVLRIVGQPWLQVEIYRPERLRCSVCGKVFTAILPQEVVSESRADSSAKAIVTLLKYRGGVPFYRQGQIQDILSTPISPSQIWEMTEEVANATLPVYALLCKEAASADLLHNDDTRAKILSREEELKKLSDEANRTGTFTTCILAAWKESPVQISLFFTGWKHAGENMNDLLAKRPKDLSPPIQQCDALSRNIPEAPTQVSNCLAHLRRKFYELVDIWPKEVTKIIGEFAVVFVNDHESPEDHEKRLKWHQEKSKPVMEKIREYCNQLIDKQLVEPNSSMGKAIAYLNKHWEGFTLFLRIPGVPLTNNATERSLKTVVLNRKNAYFFQNETGAKIADVLMSVIETCALNQVNPYNFLIALQNYRKDVTQNPELWLPWVYEKRFKDLHPIPP